MLHGAAGRRTVGNNNSLSPFHLVFLPAGKQGRTVLNLVVQMMIQELHDFRVLGGEAPDIVMQAGNVVTVRAAKIGHGQPSVLPREVRMIGDPLLHFRVQAFHNGQLALFRHHKLLAHM